MSHYLVAKLPDVDAAFELSESKRIIEKQLGEEIEFFAYPYGDASAAGPRDFELAAKAGFKASLTTRKGVIFAEHANHLQALPRIMVSGRYQEPQLVKTLINGLPTALLNKFSKVNVKP